MWQKRINAGLVRVLFVLLCVVSVLSQKTKGGNGKSKSRQRSQGSSHIDGMFFIGFLLAFIFLIPVSQFCYNVARDPATPQLITDGTRIIKERMFGYLSKSKRRQ